MKVAIVHTAFKLNAKKHNLDKVKRLVREAREKGATVTILPGMFNHGPVLSFFQPSQCSIVIRNQAEKIPLGSTVSLLLNLAATQGLFIITGPIIERAGPRTFLTSLAVSPTGILLAKYRKIALNPEDEEYGFTSGKSVTVVSIKESFGLLAENDLYYPEIARGLLLRGATALLAFLRVYPHFDLRVKRLLEARSIENRLPLVAVGGAVMSQDKILAETPSFIVDPSEGIVEEIRLNEILGEQSDSQVTLVEIKGAPPAHNRRRNSSDIERILRVVYKSLKQQARQEKR